MYVNVRAWYFLTSQNSFGVFRFSTSSTDLSQHVSTLLNLGIVNAYLGIRENSTVECLPRSACLCLCNQAWQREVRIYVRVASLTVF